MTNLKVTVNRHPNVRVDEAAGREIFLEVGEEYLLSGRYLPNLVEILNLDRLALVPRDREISPIPGKWQEPPDSRSRSIIPFPLHLLQRRPWS